MQGAAERRRGGQHVSPVHVTRSRAGDEALDEMRIGSNDVGAAATLTEVRPPRGWRPPVREFPIGFHVAAPGPSHPEPAPAPARRTPARQPARKGKSGP
jgi:hypothetical protein